MKYYLSLDLFWNQFKMKTIKLTDDQFETLFNRIDKMVKTIIDASVEYQKFRYVK